MQKPTEEDLVQASCLCNSHSFSVPAHKIRFGFASCHCSVCRQSHAAPFVMWAGMNADASTPDIFKVVSTAGSPPLTCYRSSSCCSRYFCSTCGTHLYIKYDDPLVCPERWAGEVHFPTALVDPISLQHLEEAVQKAERPRYLHVFYSDRHGCMGSLQDWAGATKFGGTTGLEALTDT
ncbi:hypothetical protein EON64_04680 [archaeon]|nr:MAG: hypothetical protein EON64_04680 [archaeon]